MMVEDPNSPPFLDRAHVQELLNLANNTGGTIGPGLMKGAIYRSVFQAIAGVPLGLPEVDFYHYSRIRDVAQLLAEDMGDDDGQIRFTGEANPPKIT